MENYAYATIDGGPVYDETTIAVRIRLHMSACLFVLALMLAIL